MINRHLHNKLNRLSKKSAFFSKPLKLLVITITSIFIAETFIMLLLSYLPPLPNLTRIIIDPIFLVIVIFPMLYYFIFQPLQKNIKINEALQKSITETEERERRRLGQDLHDDLGQLLTGIAFNLQGLIKKLESKNDTFIEDAENILSYVNEAKEKVSTISKGLAPVTLDPEGLMAALKGLAAQTERIFGIKCTFNISTPILIVDETVSIEIYRIAQEAVTNAVKHAKAKRIEISLSSNNGYITLSVLDDGVGIPKDVRSPGMGLKIMSYRAHIINARLNIQQQGNHGTLVECICTKPKSM